MKNKHVMGSVMFLVGVMSIPAYAAHAEIAGHNSTNTLGSINLYGSIQDNSANSHTYSGDVGTGSPIYGIGVVASESTASVTIHAMFDFSIFMSDSGGDGKNTKVPKAVIKTRITAYTSTPNQTDDTPYTTALGTEVHDGVIAANFLPFGTRVMIPSLFGNKVFTVEDRMNLRYRHSIDIWMPNISHALYFGVRYAEIRIVGSAKEDRQEFALSLK